MKREIQNWIVAKLQSTNVGALMQFQSEYWLRNGAIRIALSIGLLIFLIRSIIMKLVGSAATFGRLEEAPLRLANLFLFTLGKRPPDTIRRVSILCNERDTQIASDVVRSLRDRLIDCTVTIVSETQETTSKYEDTVYFVNLKRSKFFTHSGFEPSVILQLSNLKSAIYLSLSRDLDICAFSAATMRRATALKWTTGGEIFSISKLVGYLAKIDTQIGAFPEARNQIVRNWQNRISPWTQDKTQPTFLNRTTSILQCPLCKSELLHRPSNSFLSCTKCKRIFPFNEFDFDFMPHEFVLSDWHAVWRAWYESQIQAMAHYQTSPQWNVSHGEREDVKAFNKFVNAQPNERILDIGCGTSSEDIIGSHSNGIIVGIDPYLSEKRPGSLIKIRGVAEALPTKSNFFDKAIFSTSLDHVISPLQSFRECNRVLKTGGSLIIWDTLLTVDTAFTKFEYLEQFRSTSHLRETFRRLISMISGHFPVIGYLIYSSTLFLKIGLKLPPTRIDSAHLYRLNHKTLIELADATGFKTFREELAPVEVSRPFKSSFIEFKKLREL